VLGIELKVTDAAPPAPTVVVAIELITIVDQIIPAQFWQVTDQVPPLEDLQVRQKLIKDGTVQAQTAGLTHY